MPDRSASARTLVPQSVHIEQAGPEHMAEVMAVSHAAEDAPQWPPDAWKNFVEPSSYAGERKSVLLLARLDGGEAVGWLAATGIYETVELEYVLVHPRHRGKGVGGQLLEHWLMWAGRRGALEALLEVRPSNHAAIRLYRQLGFVERGRRSAYYQHPPEDAALMWCALQPGAAG